MAGELTAKDFEGHKLYVCSLCAGRMTYKVWRVRIEPYIVDTDRRQGNLVDRPAVIFICENCAVRGDRSIIKMQERARLTEGPGL